MTMDQVAAQHIGQDTPLPSLELMIEEATLSCGDGLSCAYRDTIAWQNANSPLPMENNPQVVFEKLFGDGNTDAERRARREQAVSLLDSVVGEVSSLQKKAAGRRSDAARPVPRRHPRSRTPHSEGRRTKRRPS